MSPENMGSNRGGEYDAFKPRNLRQRIGAFLVRHLIQGDDVARIRDRALGRDISDVLTHGLEDEFDGAIRRAQSLLVAVDETRLPGFLNDDPGLSGVDQDELSSAVEFWGELCADQLEDLRTDTTTCAYMRDNISADDRVDFSVNVSRAENGLRTSLYRKFRLDE